MQDAQKDSDGMTRSARPARRPGRRWALGAALLVLAVPALAGALWLRLAAGPIALPGEVRSRIEARLDAGMAGGTLSVGDMAVELPDGARRPVLVFSDVALADPGGAPRAAFPNLRIAFDPAAALTGRMRPRSVEIAGAGLSLSRDAAGRFDLDLAGAGAAGVSLPETMARLDAMFASPVFDRLEDVRATGLRVEMTDAMTDQVVSMDDATAELTRAAGRLALVVRGTVSGSRETTLDLAVLREPSEDRTGIAVAFRDLAARDLATAHPALAWLDLMRAPISGRLALDLADDGTLGDLEARLDIGAGRIALGPGQAPAGFDALTAELAYDPATRRVVFDRLRLDAAQLRFGAGGHADVAEDGRTFVAQFSLADIVAQPGGLLDAPVSLEGAAVDMRLTLGDRPRVEIAQAVVHDADLRLTLRGMAEARERGLALSLDASVPEVPVSRVLSLWPEGAAEGTRRWLSENVQDGRARGVDLAIRAEPGTPLRRHLQMSLEGGVLTPLRDGPPLRDVSGHLELDGSRLVLRLDDGRMSAGGGDVRVGEVVMTVADNSEPGPRAAFRLSGEGEVADLLRILDAPPIRIFREGEMTPERIGTGRVAFEAAWSSRLMPRDRPASLAELGLTASGRVTDFASDELVPGRRLAAERLDVTLVPDRITVAGRASFDGVPAEGRWSRALGPDAPRTARVEARADVDRAALERLGLSLPEGLVSGRGQADLAIDLPPGAPPQLQVTSDLGGLALAVPALGWRSPAAQTGRLEAALRLGPVPEVTALALRVPGFDLRGRVRIGADGAVLTAERLVVGDWLDVSGVLRGRGEGVPPEIEVTGGRLSLDRMPEFGPPGAGQDPLPLMVRLDRVEVARDLALTGLVGSFSTGGGLSGEFDAAVNGGAGLSGMVEPGPTGPLIRLFAADGGAVLRAAGIFRNAHGGAMSLRLQATGAPRTFDGALRIDGPRLRDAPAMAELLNAISVVGLIEQLSGEGINLGTVEARFRLDPARLTLSEGSALGPALGITMEGIYDLAARRYDMQGVVSPLYVLNGLAGGLFAPRGEGLFGFSYSLTGAGEQASVSVNPLSILTPGIFREIFRRPPPGSPGN
jgi:hypothetical protein